jgi:hypothetical protein
MSCTLLPGDSPGTENVMFYEATSGWETTMRWIALDLTYLVLFDTIPLYCVK